MKDDIKAAFKKVISQSDARDEAAKQEQQRIATASQEFQTEFKRVMDEVIVPTLNEIGNTLQQQSDWICKTVPDAGGVKFEIYRGNMMALGGLVRPHISFSPVPGRLTMGVISFSQSSGGGQQEYALGQVFDDFVADQVLQFFKRLSAER